jgi:hypothetical protein
MQYECAVRCDDRLIRRWEWQMRTNQLAPNKWVEPGIFSLIADALAHPAPEREGFERRDTRATQAPAEAPPRRRGLFERLDHWLWRRRQRDVDAHLARATDVHDLEARMRALERDAPHPYY